MWEPPCRRGGQKERGGEHGETITPLKLQKRNAHREMHDACGFQHAEKRNIPFYNPASSTHRITGRPQTWCRHPDPGKAGESLRASKLSSPRAAPAASCVLRSRAGLAPEARPSDKSAILLANVRCSSGSLGEPPRPADGPFFRPPIAKKRKTKEKEEGKRLTPCPLQKKKRGGNRSNEK